MFLQISQLFYPLLVAGMPVLISRWARRFHKGMTGFRLLAANSDHRLRQIRRIAWAVIFSFLTSRVLMGDRSPGVTACMLLCLLLCKERLVHDAIAWLAVRRRFIIASASVVACAAVPILYPFAMTLALLLLASWCYPTQEMIDAVRRPCVQSELCRQLHSADTSHPMLPKSRILYNLYAKQSDQL